MPCNERQRCLITCLVWSLKWVTLPANIFLSALGRNVTHRPPLPICLHSNFLLCFSCPEIKRSLFLIPCCNNSFLRVLSACSPAYTQPPFSCPLSSPCPRSDTNSTHSAMSIVAPTLSRVLPSSAQQVVEWVAALPLLSVLETLGRKRVSNMEMEWRQFLLATDLAPNLWQVRHLKLSANCSLQMLIHESLQGKLICAPHSCKSAVRHLEPPHTKPTFIWAGVQAHCTAGLKHIAANK